MITVLDVETTFMVNENRRSDPSPFCPDNKLVSVQYSQNSDGSINYRCAGYCNTTTAIDGVQFKMSSGNIDSGTIKLYGIKGS